mmetsp:Transcript_3365/g.2914  ORF Transcript_3365/g.2914 Transcript_3365/m.2914 type:complete len:220 (-) Transcript_3365:121-780(-)|eukprot:CAMPEP_0114588692 /NCGR_PEP_ID=MMETSP0125-20121206/11336_1 /TAXON_ID=485358 ORGANISM="Aristerostoma sp., Strain ATCC 50986" /NCGR_SAMPLE_ID=MMETSP0125 /ASSEMBLY_ACC=CAM_ASM_000245 /LENGTH=219 /DNA_ID=CAMNT_0001785225 /DNA_START=216 /DNA_END=875 /DNA_ORIENTATION=-
MLLDFEVAYLGYLELKKINVGKLQDKIEESKSSENEKIRNEIMELQKNDRDVIEKGKSAFVSFMRSYKEHDLKYIFKHENMDIGDTANSFFLFRIPRVKEILGKKIDGFKETKINFEDVKFVDKNQESQYLQKRERNQQRREEKEAYLLEQKKKYEEKKKAKGRSKSQRKKRNLDDERKNFDEFTEEERLVKKLKKGQITLASFKERMKDLDLSDVEED